MIRAEMDDCQRCALASGRSCIVFGAAPARPPLLFVVPPPSREDDSSGAPLGGGAGELFVRMLAAMHFERCEVGVVPVVACHPPQNRPATGKELGACAPFVRRQILAAAPQILLVCGHAAAEGLFGSDFVFAEERGKWRTWEGLPALVTHDPAWLLQHPAAKRETWDDLKAVLRRLDHREAKESSA